MVHPPSPLPAAGFALPSFDALGRVAYVVGLAALSLIAIWLSFLRARTLYGGGSDDREPRVNCPSCGARTSAEPGRCEYCDEPLDG